MSDYLECVNCGARIQLVNFALGQMWMHWPTPYGNYQTNELYQSCRSEFVATPPPLTLETDR